MKVEKVGDAVAIRIEIAGEKERALVEAIRQCRQSAWACTSGECVNIESIAESVEGTAILLTLTPKSGAQLDPSGIEECLRYLVPQNV